MNFKMKKKAQSFTIESMSQIGIALVVTAVTLGIGATILSNIQAGQTVNTVAYNATNFGLQGVNTLASYQTTVALVAAAAVVLGIIFVFFRGR